MPLNDYLAPADAEGRRRFWRVTYRILFISALLTSVLVLMFFFRTYQTIGGHLAQHQWSIPATVYARTPVLEPGSPATQRWLLEYLERLEYQKTEQVDVRTAQYAVQDSTIILRKNRNRSEQSDDYAVAITFNKKGVKNIVQLATGQELPAVSLEPVPITSLFGDQWEKRMLVSVDQVPEHVKNAVLAIEDRRFYDHNGIDARGVMRAVWNNVVTRDSLQGASTITQQLAKNFYLTPERSLRRKGSEAVMALMMERKLSKKKILELYLNEVYFGQRGAMSINGIGAASRLFFRKDVRDLSLPEASLLAGMIRAPATYNPYRHPAEAQARRNTVLLAMRENGYITDAQYTAALKTPIVVYPFDTRVSLAPYFGDLVKQQLLEKYKADDLHNRNLHIFSTIDLDMQEAGEAALSQGLKQIDRIRIKNVKKEVQGCLIAIEPQTGFIRAFVGGRSYSKSQFNRINLAERQPGSAFKPIVFATALEMTFKGYHHYTPAALISDEPAIFKFHKAVWEPKNYDNRFYGIVSMRSALANSLNVATAKLAQHVGLQRVVQSAKAFGFENVKPYPSLALGSFVVNPWQLAEAYTVFANSGVKTELRAIESVTDLKGQTIDRTKIETRQVIHPQTAFVITDMLRSVMISGTGAASSRMGFTKPAAGKTGTTDDYRDAWFIGYTPDLICLVWTGYDDNSPLRMNGAQAALPIWVNFMKKVQTTGREFKAPEGLVTRVVDPATGKLVGPFCSQTVTEIFIEGSEPVDTCTEYEHYSPGVIDFSTDPVRVKQVEPEPSASSVHQAGGSGEYIYFAPGPDARQVSGQSDDVADPIEASPEILPNPHGAAEQEPDDPPRR